MENQSLNADMLDLRPAGGGEYRANCPYCGDRRRHLYVNRDRGVFHCFRCGRAGRLAETGASPVVVRSTPRPAGDGGPRPLPDDGLDRAYRALLARLLLLPHHRAHLVDVRGFSADLIERGLYRSLPATPELREDAGNAAARSVGAYGGSRVPGLARTRGGWTVVGPPGLLVPVRDRGGGICGVQLRLDAPKEGAPRYVWLSSRRRGGAPAVARLHWAIPPGSDPAEDLWITEGPLKADYAAWRLGIPCVAVPGVTACRRPVLGAVVGQASVVVAFDADLYENPQVRRCALQLVEALERRGVRVTVAVWPPERGKGLDDLLRAGGRPVVMAPFAWRALLTKEEGSMLKMVGWVRVASAPESQTVAREDREPMQVFRVTLEVPARVTARGIPLRLPAVAFYQRADQCATLGLKEGDSVFVAGSLTSVRQRAPAGSGWVEVPGVLVEEIVRISPSAGAQDAPDDDDGLPF